MQLRLATFNLENLDGRIGVAPPLADRIAVLRPQLLRLRADILCLQEINGQELIRRQPRTLNALDRLLEDTPYVGYSLVHTRGPRGAGPADRHNLVVLSRFPIEASRQIRHELVQPLSYRPSTAIPPASAAMELSWDRPILYLAIELQGGQRLHVLNLHLKAPIAVPIPGQKLSAESWKSIGGWAEGFFVASTKRAGQALEARLFIDRLFDVEPKALIAACGDFNADEYEVPIRIIRGGNANGEEPDVSRDARTLAALERKIPMTRRYSVLHAGRRVMLDHLLVSRRLAACVSAVEVHNENLQDEAIGPVASGLTLGSYHAPVVAEFALSDPTDRT